MQTFSYKILFWTLVAALPFVFAYNTELFHYINCPGHGGFWNTFFLLLTSLADGLWIVMLASLLQSLLHAAWSRPFAQFILALIVGNIVLQALKYAFDAPRPAVVFADQICILGQRLTARSFPSGHTFTAVLLFMHLRPQKLWSLGLLLAALTLFAALSRIYVGAHFPRDLIVGALLAVLSYAAVERALRRITPWRIAAATRRLLLALLGLATACVYIFLYHEKTRELEYLLTPFAWVIASYWIFNLVLLSFQTWQKKHRTANPSHE